MVLNWHFGVFLWGIMSVRIFGDTWEAFFGGIFRRRVNFFAGEMSGVGVHIPVQHYKSLCLVVVIWASLIDTD